MVVALAAWPGGSHAQDAQTTAAREPVEELYAGLRTIMQMGGHATFQQQFDRLAPVIEKVFDLEAILRTSVGLRWASLGDAEKQRLFSVFRAFTIASYTANFSKDNGEKFLVLPSTRPEGADIIVESTLTPSGSDPIKLDYVTHDAGAGWRIIDVLLNGSISRVAVQRSDFRALLASGSATPLIDSLRQKVADLSDGAMRP